MKREAIAASRCSLGHSKPGSRTCLHAGRCILIVPPCSGSRNGRDASPRRLTPSPRKRLSITQISCWQEVNPEGILSLSPGLRGTSYPGCGRSKEAPTLNGLQPLTGTGAARQEPAPCCNPFRVERGSETQPRVARASQPWTAGYNPFGIEQRHADLWGVTGRKRGEGNPQESVLAAPRCSLRWVGNVFPA